MTAFLALVGPAVAGDIDEVLGDGVDAYQHHNYEIALQLLRPLAESGNILAQDILGDMYENGRGVKENLAEAMKWYRLAADQGNAAAQYNLGNIYDFGWGVPKNNAEAMNGIALLQIRATPPLSPILNF